MSLPQQTVAIVTDSKEFVNLVSKCLPKNWARGEQIETKNIAKIKTLASSIPLVLVDCIHIKDAALSKVFSEISKNAFYTVAVLDESDADDSFAKYLEEGLIDDLLLVPIRPIELFSKLKHAIHLAKVHDIDLANTNLKVLIEKIEEDIKTARSIQKSLIPEKFPPVYGFKVAHKYLSGMKSGGDYIDFFEFDDKNHVGILMSDSTGYGLSSAFMSVILRLAIKLSKEEAQSPSKTVAKIFDELQLAMKPNENLSIFYGVLNKKTFELSYTGAGNIRFFHGAEGTSFKDHDLNPDGFLKGAKLQLKDKKVMLNPGERVVLMSDGFFENFESSDGLKDILAKTSTEEAVSIVNECVYRIKQKFTPDDDMPAQDCSVLVIDVAKRAMRLAK